MPDIYLSWFGNICAFHPIQCPNQSQASKGHERTNRNFHVKCRGSLDASVLFPYLDSKRDHQGQGSGTPVDIFKLMTLSIDP